MISVDDLDGLRGAPPGNLHAVAVELREMTKVTKELNEPEMPASSLLESQRACNWSAARSELVSM